MVGIDRWGVEYASYSRKLCERNAQAEGVDNAAFQKGDARHLDFPDETFDAVTSKLRLPQHHRRGQAGAAAGDVAGAEEGWYLCHS